MKLKKLWREKNSIDSVSGDKYLKTKIKSYNIKITTNFKNVKSNSTKPPKEGSNCICLSAVVIDSVFKSDKNF